MLTRVAILFLVLAAPARAFELGLPVACALGVDCFVQQYADRDPGPGVRDYACGSATYDGHDGTDIRVKTLADVARGVAVIASAPGTVKALRDGLADKIVASDADRAAVKDRECGNGVVIDHGDSWETQYCHMKEGSVAVAKGTKVAAGDRLGDVGYSGMAQFPHVHLTVRRDGRKLDPFAPADASACKLSDDNLWNAASRQHLVYTGGDLLALGFTPKTLELGDVLSEPVPAPNGQSSALAAYAWLINLRQGDRIAVTLKGPEDEMATNEVTLDRNKAAYLLFAGKKLRAERWPSGEYAARVVVTRDGKSLIDRQESLKLE